MVKLANIGQGPTAADRARISAVQRPATLDALEQGLFDCVVIGGGIAGAGIACESAQRGLRTALVELDDFASGTSSRSTKLIHGGLRYLALGELAHVRETARERKTVRYLAPHLAQPCWAVLPARSRAALTLLRLAVMTYEHLGQVASEDRHQIWNSDELERHEPVLDRQRYPFACAYREYLTDDARLVLANLRAAVRAGALLINHAAVDRITNRFDAHEVGVSCRLSGRRLTIRSRAVINAAG
ncbi:MAG: FAD-dependent oxidoreductase, partial [Proteobacteria bacterium]|nr:FAD-dependent oxidoreductase [Pseudomonadota bacterium]